MTWGTFVCLASSYSPTFSSPSPQRWRWELQRMEPAQRGAYQPNFSKILLQLLDSGPLAAAELNLGYLYNKTVTKGDIEYMNNYRRPQGLVQQLFSCLWKVSLLRGNQSCCNASVLQQHTLFSGRLLLTLLRCRAWELWLASQGPCLWYESIPSSSARVEIVWAN